jgi:hypothetical protein
MDAPRNVVVILLDSLNRHMLGSYGGREFQTPNLARMPGSKAPVIRQDRAEGDKLPFRAFTRFTGHHVDNLDAGSGDRLHAALKELDAPDSQFARLGFA